MKIAIQILKKELIHWKEEYVSDKRWEKRIGDSTSKSYVRQSKKHITELEKAIKILMNAAPKSGT